MARIPRCRDGAGSPGARVGVGLRVRALQGPPLFRWNAEGALVAVSGTSHGTRQSAGAGVPRAMAHGTYRRRVVVLGGGMGDRRGLRGQPALSHGKQPFACPARQPAAPPCLTHGRIGNGNTPEAAGTRVVLGQLTSGGTAECFCIAGPHLDPQYRKAALEPEGHLGMA